MISTYDLKKQFQNLLRPISKLFIQWGWTPNAITFFTMILSLAAAAAVAFHHSNRWIYLLVPVFLFVRMALNAIDGMMAKEHGMTSPLGVFLNELGDVISDSALFFAFCFVPDLRPALLILTAFLSTLSEMTSLIGVQIGSPRPNDGPMGKSDRAVVMSVVSILLFSGIEAKIVYDLIIGATAVALVVTIFNRGRKALGHSK